ncbi:hypothetical protein [Actinocatenispora comari]|nr:hypothetical protein [Actinocatenispora comari]
MSNVERVAQYNQRQQDAFAASRLCRLLADNATDAATKAAVRTWLQPWSDAFQRMITVRVEAETDPQLRAQAIEHRDEELDHNLLLARSRTSAGDPHAEAGFDPVIEAGAAWFTEGLRLQSGVGRAVLAHLALEAAASTFFSRIGVPAYPDDVYFAHHDEADAEHLEMGYQVLRERADWTEEQVLSLLDHAWQVMTMIADRIADRAISDAIETPHASVPRQTR